MIEVISIFERIGLGGGGKVKAVLTRMNALAELPHIAPVLLVLDHSLRQKQNFAQLQAEGKIAARVRMMTLPEMCAQAAQGGVAYADFPAFDETRAQGSNRIYLKDGHEVMQDRSKKTLLGTQTKRIVPDATGERRYTFLDGVLHQQVQHRPDGTLETTDYVRGVPVRWLRSTGRQFVLGRNLLTDTICRMERIFVKNLFEMVDWTQRVVFFDGVTSAYLSAAATRRVLMLHADHRSPEGPIVPRSRYLIENFQGEAILTSTQVHKRRLEEDVTPGAPIHVIPHYCETEGGTDGGTGGARRDLVTVSRLELTGKPIHQCIEAFCRIMGEFQDVDYVIYGLGAGQAALEALIAELGCGDRVTLAGYTTAPLEVFRGAIASVYPTMTEGFGLSILEALASGCPVITYDVDYGPREMITPGQNGELVAPGDIDGLAQAMRAVLSDSDAYQQRSAMGLERYGRDAFVRNYAQLIEALAAPTCADG